MFLAHDLRTMRMRRMLLTGTSLLLGGCIGTVITPEGAPSLEDSQQPPAVPGTPGGGGGTGGGGTGGGTGGGQNPNPGPLPDITPAPSVRIARLTHAQWQATVRDLFGLDSSAPNWSTSFRSDANQGGFLFGNQAATLVVDQTLEAAYERAAEEVATYVTSQAGALDRYLPASGNDAERARAFASSFGTRAHRRPLDAGEVDAYMSVFNVGVQYPQGQPPFTSGLRLMIKAFLSAPKFIYRIEMSSTEANGLVPLDGYEVASRLSYFLWDTMPDDALLDAAAAGTLTTTEGVRQQAERMLADVRALAVSERFHDLILDVYKYDNINPSRQSFPDAPSNFPALARQETHMVLQDAFEADRGWRDLLTTRETFVNQDLAPLYGLSGNFGPQFERVTLDAAQRAGLFTQLGFLASHATQFQPDPIHRGVFLTLRVACNGLGAPPDNLPPLPVPAPGQTNREVIEDLTEVPGSNCAGCHTTLINPFGFPFEGYDSTGRVRPNDNGLPLDTTATVRVQTNAAQQVQNGVELANVLASDELVHQCYARHWVEFAFGRTFSAGDRGLIANLGRASLEGASIRKILADLVASPAFLNRTTEEL